MTRQPSLTSGYISVILRAIETTKNDPAQLRNLVYELAKMSLGKQLLAHYHEIGSAGLHQHLFGLDAAIKKVESLSQEETLAHRLNLQLIEEPAIPIDEVTINVDDELPDTRPVIVHQTPVDFYYNDYPLPTFLNPHQIWEPIQSINRPRKRVWSNIRSVLHLAIGLILGMAIYIGYVVSHYVSTRVPLPPEDVAQSLRSAPKIQNEQTNRSGRLSSDHSGVPNFELPTAYGVYALSDGKLYELEPLPIKVPDQRIAISSMISMPSPVTIPKGKLTFVVFRRDLVSSAPDKVLIRVVARVARAMKFTGTGPPKITTVDDQWAVRGYSYEFGVAPLNDNPEMITIRAASPEFLLPSGRYALALKGQAFDFNIDGPVTDAAHCLERTDAVGGAVYSECRKIP